MGGNKIEQWKRWGKIFKGENCINNERECYHIPTMKSLTV